MFYKETEYALRGLIYIQIQNLEGHRPGIIEIAEEIDAPKYYIAKILQRLVRDGIVNSQKGKGGGFFFDPEKQEVPLKAVIQTIEGDKIFSGCGLGLRHCSNANPCPLHEQYKAIRESIDKLISEETIQSVANKNYGSLQSGFQF